MTIAKDTSQGSAGIVCRMTDQLIKFSARDFILENKNSIISLALN